MEKLHTGKVAIITGGNAGLGLAAARELVKEGAKVCLVARNNEKLQTAVGSLKAEFSGAEVITVAVDVASPEGTEKYVNETLQAFGTVDYLVNNAGSDGQMAHLVDYDMEVFRKVIETNLIASANGIKHVAPILIKKGKGAIVSVASTAGVMSLENLSAYSASKHGIIGLTKTAAIELGPKGIRVNAIAPGGTKTEMLEAYLESEAQKQGISAADVEKSQTGNVPLRRFGRPSEQAQVISFLLSDMASYISGTTILVDGGQSVKLA